MCRRIGAAIEKVLYGAAKRVNGGETRVWCESRRCQEEFDIEF